MALPNDLFRYATIRFPPAGNAEKLLRLIQHQEKLLSLLYLRLGAAIVAHPKRADDLTNLLQLSCCTAGGRPSRRRKKVIQYFLSKLHIEQAFLACI